MTRLIALGTLAMAIAWRAATDAEAQKKAPPPSGAPSTLWHVEVQGHGRPAVDGTTAYFLTRQHEIVAVDAVSGIPRWSRATNEPGDVTAGSAVALAGPVVVAGDYNIVAFDRASGAERWHFVPVVGHAPGIYLGEHADGKIYAGSAAGRVHAIRAASGELAWSAALAPSSASTVFAPATDGRIVVAGYTVFDRPASGGVGCLDTATGRLLWRTEFPRASDPWLSTGSAGGPVIAGETIVATRGDGDIFGFDRSTGRVKWTLPSIDTIPAILRGPLPLPESAPGPDYRPLTRSGSILIAGSLKGDVVAYDLRTLRERWHFLDPSLGSVAYGISSDEDSVYIPFGAGRHVALSTPTGAERWRTSQTSAGFFWPAASDERRVFLGGKGGLDAIRR